MNEAPKPPRFPTMLRKMWTGSEVQAWIDENWNRRAPPEQPAALTSEQRARLISSGPSAGRVRKEAPPEPAAPAHASAIDLAIHALQWHVDNSNNSFTDEPRKRDCRAIRALRAVASAPSVALEPPKEKIAPVQGWPQGIPWSLHLEAYAAYSKMYGPQPALIDLEGRNCRGGFGLGELDLFIPGWRDKVAAHPPRAPLTREDFDRMWGALYGQHIEERDKVAAFARAVIAADRGISAAAIGEKP